MPYPTALTRAILERTGFELHLVFTPAAGQVLLRECGVALQGGMVNLAEFLSLDAASPEAQEAARRIIQYPPRDIGARLASGSFLHDGMIVCPTSANTLGSLAAGMTPNLLTRAADVTLKEGRKLLLVPRETPLSLIHLRAMTTLAEAGAIILPAMPGFYHRPQTVEDIVNFMVMKIFDRMGFPLETDDRWNPTPD
jgi:4-hydroxy-3-polyprenylbenzoate decarboxylase